MFALNSYLDKLYQIQWKFNIEKLEELEELLFVEFKQNDKGYFVIKTIHYSAIDILQGLEEIDFVLSKVQNEIIIELV